MQISFQLSATQLQELLQRTPNLGKNSHVGELAVEIAKFYFQTLDPEATFLENINHVDLQVTYSGKTENYEIKGTTDPSLAWSKLKVSSRQCHDHLQNGMKILRVCNVGQPQVSLFFLEYGKHFTLAQEPRWSVKKVKDFKKH